MWVCEVVEMSNTINWEGKEITYDDWDNDRSGWLVFRASDVDWDGTADGLTTALENYLNTLPLENGVGWPKTTIDVLHLSGNLTTDGIGKSLVVFPAAYEQYLLTK